MVRVKDNVGKHYLTDDCRCERDDGMGRVQGHRPTNVGGSERDEPDATNDNKRGD